MKLKVCGMKYPENIEAVARLKPDYMGFIFYPNSVRYVNIHEIKKTVTSLEKNITKVGVFVNNTVDEVVKTCQKLQLNYAQLHGHESPLYTTQIKTAGIHVIKAFQINAGFDWNHINDFKDYVDFLLFDTPCPQYGGSGQKFDWELLKKYRGETPFFLSGGIDVENVCQINKLSFPQLWGIDVNSRIESAPATKDIKRLELLINELENE